MSKIYDKHRSKYPENASDSEQMCLMWSTDDPPDVLEDTEPLQDIEEAFDIYLNDDDAYALYDMDLAEAAKRLLEIQQET
ncbi:MAG: hypothetical protein QTN59_12335 [Candidatus Electrothrix communis]|nr:MAG: hypothetical protein QTN59_12335 [Candidatus Electrothrix communis]